MMRRIVLAAVVLLGALLPAARAEASENAVWVGGCVMSFNVSWSGLKTLPGPQSMSFSGSGTCVLNEKIVPAAYQGYAAWNPLTGGMGCFSGVVTGTAGFYAASPGWPNPTVSVTIVNKGGVMTLFGIKEIISFDGTGEYFNLGDYAACDTASGMTSSTWTGPYVMQDPVLPKP